MNAATNQPSILTFRLGQSNQAGHRFIAPKECRIEILSSEPKMGLSIIVT